MNATLKTPARPQGCTALLLKRLSRQVNRHFDAEVSRAGLKITQYSLLSFIVKLGPLRQTDLAAHLGLDASTLTRNLRPLVAQGWVEVLAGDDARSLHVQATPEGSAKRAEAQRRWRAAQDDLNARLGLERVAALHELLNECNGLLADPETGTGDSDHA